MKKRREDFCLNKIRWRLDEEACVWFSCLGDWFCLNKHHSLSPLPGFEVNRMSMEPYPKRRKEASVKLSKTCGLMMMMIVYSNRDAESVTLLHRHRHQFNINSLSLLLLRHRHQFTLSWIVCLYPKRRKEASVLLHRHRHQFNINSLTLLLLQWCLNKHHSLSPLPIRWRTLEEPSPCLVSKWIVHQFILSRMCDSLA